MSMALMGQGSEGDNGCAEGAGWKMPRWYHGRDCVMDSEHKPVETIAKWGEWKLKNQSHVRGAGGR